MADRTVEVKLRLVTDQYKREALGAASATEKFRDGLDDVDEELKRIPPDAAKAAAAMKLLGTETIGTGNYIKGIGDKAHALQILDGRVREAELSVRRLGQEFVRTGSIDVWESLNRADSQLRSLSAMRKRLVDALQAGAKEGGKAAAGTFAQVFQGGITSAFQSLPSEAKVALIASLVGVVVAASPLIGATMAAGILAGVGGAGIAAGIALVAQDPIIGAAYSALGKQIGDRLRASAVPFKEELVDASLVFGAAFDRQSTRFDRIFADLARNIEPLAAGLSEMAENALPGIERAAQAAGPVLRAIADSLPMMGRALDMFFDSMAASGPGAAEAMRFILAVVSALIVEIGMVVEVLAKAYEGFSKIARFVGSIFYDNLDEPKTYADKLGEVEESADGAGTALDRFGRQVDDTQAKLDAAQQAVNATKVTLDSLAATMVNKVFTATMGLDQATLGWQRSLTSLNETLKSNGKSLDITKEKGQANVAAIYSTVQANMQLYQAMIQVGATAEQATAAYEANTAALERQLRKAGLTQVEIDGLIGKYKGVPRKVDTMIAMQGLEDAIRDLTTTIRLINGLRDKTVTITVKQAGDNPRGQSRGGGWATGGIRRAAVGMVVPPSDPGTVLMGEPQTGGEALIPLQGITASRAMDLSRVVGNSYGFDVAPRGLRRGGGGMPSSFTIYATFVDPVNGEVTRRQVVTAAANRGQTVAQFWGVGER